MSARVFNPMVITEMRRILRANENGQHVAVADLARVRKNLFGCVDHEENKRFVESELAAQQKRDADLYEFDFVRGVPYPNSRRYVWERVVDKVPEPYALRRLPFLRDHTAATVPIAAVVEETSEVRVDQASESSERRAIATKTKQSSISDFMKSRKRPSNGSSVATAAKLSSTEHTSSKQAKKSHS